MVLGNSKEPRVRPGKRGGEGGCARSLCLRTANMKQYLFKHPRDEIVIRRCWLPDGLLASIRPRIVLMAHCNRLHIIVATLARLYMLHPEFKYQLLHRQRGERHIQLLWNGDRAEKFLMRYTIWILRKSR